jgi:hypothetical protein
VDVTIQEVGGSGSAYQVLSFPAVSNQSWDRWALEDGTALVPPYTITVKLNVQSSVADRGGITIAWNDANWDRIDIQPNVYWRDIEFRVTYTGSNPSSVSVTGPATTNGGLGISSGVDYWLRASVTSAGPGQGSVVVSWSTDGRNFRTVLTASGLADVSGLAGVGTAGPNLPAIFFDDFRVQ